MKLDFETTVDVEINEADGSYFTGKVKLPYVVDLGTATWGINKMEVIPDVGALKGVIVFDENDVEKEVDLNDMEYTIRRYEDRGTTPTKIIVKNGKIIIHVEEVL